MMRSGIVSRSAFTTLAVGGACVGLLIAGLGAAQDGRPAGFAGLPSFADVVEDVSPAVVNIAVTKDPMRLSSAQGDPRFGGVPMEEFLERFGFGKGFGAPGRPARGEGSGFIIDPEGYVATNNHVVDGASEVTVTLNSGEQLAATVVGTDPRTDLALLKIENGGDLPALRLGDSSEARVGDWVLAIGNPFGLGGSATAGIVSARGRDIQSGPYDDYLQIDAPINSGNSGGPIFNAAGEVIGINTAIFSPNGGNIGIGFAIPSNQAVNVLDELREQGSVDRGWLGVEIGPAGDDSGVESGVMIARIVNDGPADGAGLVTGDVIVALDGEPIDSPRVLSRLIGGLDAGDEVEIGFVRDGDRDEVDVVLGRLPDESELRAAVEPRQAPMRREYRYRWPEERPFFRR